MISLTASGMTFAVVRTAAVNILVVVVGKLLILVD